MVRHWYKNAIIYSLHVKSFLDANQDGVGDFKGLTRSLDYLSGLGVTCIWLLPFFPSPHKDHGYDISDFLNVDPAYGNLGHLTEFLDEAEEKGIRVIIDLVLNHTSVDHPWFQEARRNPKSKYHNYYIWVDEKPKDAEEDIMFANHEESKWEYDQEAGRYYYHTFYKHQADLNISNPDVQEEIRYILHFWLRMGVAGFRMDAVPHMLKEKGNEKFNGSPFQFLKDIRSFVEEHRPDGILLAEVDTEPEDYIKFFGKDSDQVQMLFNFYLNNYIFLALARGEGTPIAKALRKLPQTAIDQQLGTFIRNHDELDLERLTVKERNEVYKAFAPKEDMRIYERGIRRRLAPMLNNNRRMLELTYSLLLTLPGTPVLRYGDEIGMGEDLSLDQRNSVRTAMQWTGELHGGFSKNKGTCVPTIPAGAFSYKKINVHDQSRKPSSLLNWFERAIAARKECVEFGLGDYTLVRTNKKTVLAWCCEYESGHALAIHNFSNKKVTVKLSLKKHQAEHLIEHFSDRHYKTEFNLKTKTITLAPYGYRWFRKSALFL